MEKLTGNGSDQHEQTSAFGRINPDRRRRFLDAVRKMDPGVSLYELLDGIDPSAATEHASAVVGCIRPEVAQEAAVHAAEVATRMLVEHGVDPAVMQQPLRQQAL